MSNYTLFHLSDFGEYDRLLMERAFSIHSSKLDVLPGFHNLHAKPIFPELHLSIELVYVGKTSITWLSKVFDPKTDEVYVTKSDQAISVVRHTLGVVPFPDWWRSKYGPRVTEGKPLRLPTVTPPDSEDSDHVCEMVGSWNDATVAFYLGYDTIFNFGMHGIMDAVANDKLILFKHDIQKYRMKNVDIRYLHTVKGSDNITMFIRQCKENPHLIDVALRKQEQILCQMTIVFET